METNYIDSRDGDSGSPTTQPRNNRLLPWAVLLLAALALLYFLNRGCAGTKIGTGEPEGSIETSTKGAAQVAKSGDVKKLEVQSIESSGKSSENSRQNEQGGSTISMLKKVLADGEASNSAYILDDIAFEGKSATLTSNSFTQLDQLVELCLAYPGYKLRIEGHTDNSGSADMNNQLSTQRALAVKAYLLKNQIAAERITALGRGQLKPLAPNDSEAGNARNNRVEVYVLPN